MMTTDTMTGLKTSFLSLALWLAPAALAAAPPGAGGADETAQGDRKSVV